MDHKKQGENLESLINELSSNDAGKAIIKGLDQNTQETIKVFMASQDIKRAEKEYKERFIITVPILFAILIVALIEPNLIPSVFGFVTVIFIFVPRFNLAGLIGLITFIASMDIAIGTLGFLLGLTLSSPTVVWKCLSFWGVLKNNFSKNHRI